MDAPREGHARLDRRSLALHRAIADELRANPALIAIAAENIERWSLARGRTQPYWDAWREILEPFAGILQPKERWAIYERFEDRRERV